MRIPMECQQCGYEHANTTVAADALLDAIDELVGHGWAYNDWTDTLLCPQCVIESIPKGH
jgi:hypothetical protein